MQSIIVKIELARRGRNEKERVEQISNWTGHSQKGRKGVRLTKFCIHHCCAILRASVQGRLVNVERVQNFIISSPNFIFSIQVGYSNFLNRRQ